MKIAGAARGGGSRRGAARRVAAGRGGARRGAARGEGLPRRFSYVFFQKNSKNLKNIFKNLEIVPWENCEMMGCKIPRVSWILGVMILHKVKLVVYDTFLGSEVKFFP